MIPRGWIIAEPIKDCDDIVVEAYPKTLNWFGVIVLGEYVPVSVATGGDIAIDAESAELVLGARLPRAEQERQGLAELLWTEPEQAVLR